ncbi:MAG: phosphoenolpyruvate--protein phosphotransferase [Spirochaetota bacterium]|nr:phosphoenolpyruvate--protein phosphotransferase [Spirochaetota bacterium]
MDRKKESFSLSGKVLSRGFGEGKVFIYRDVLKKFDELYDIIDDSQTENEIRRLSRAVVRISGDLKSLAAHVETEIDSDLARVFHAHIAIIDDPVLRNEIEKEIRDELVSAGSAVRVVFRRWERRLGSMESELIRQKADDMRDLTRRLVSSLAGVHSHVLDDFPAGSVLIARRLLPSDTVFLSRRSASAVLLEEGGRSSHAALFAREIGLPCISGIRNILEKIEPESYAQVDAETGRIIINPDVDEKTSFHEKWKQQKLTQSAIQLASQEPAITQNGPVINVYANVGCREDSIRAIENGADGIGLYRIEQAYMGLQEPPNAARLFEIMYETLEPAKHLPVYVRLLDIGADKTLSFVDLKKEVNPSLGKRGIRFLNNFQGLLKTQINVLLQLSQQFNLHILVPMVTLPKDILLVKNILKDCAASNSIKAPLPKLGAMVETPAAALSSSDIAQYTDFLSFGTNDLTQYTFAADRENEAVEDYFDDTHNAIFRLMDIVHNDIPEMPLSLCGELAGNPEYTCNVLKCGITSLSTAPLSIPAIKKAVRESAL